MKSELNGWVRGKVAVGREIAKRAENNNKFHSLGVVVAIERREQSGDCVHKIAVTDTGNRVGYAGRSRRGGIRSNLVWSREAKTETEGQPTP
jgi:hypothetical protein